MGNEAYFRFRQPKMDLECEVESANVEMMVVGNIDLKTPELADSDAIHAAVTLADGETTEVATEISSPDMARCVTVTGNAATVTGDVVVEGKNIKGEAITDTIASNGTATVQGVKAFSEVTKITLPERAAEGDTISIGTGGKIGLPYRLKVHAVLAGFVDGTKEGTMPSVTVDSDEIEKNVVSFNTAFDGEKKVSLVLAIQ